MNRIEKLVLVKNAAANVLRGTAAALVAVILPPFLTRLMSADAYGAWSLVLQISAYVGYLDFGIQTAIGRFVAHSNESNDAKHRDGIISTSFIALTAAGALGIAGSVGAAALLPNIFHQMPLAMVRDARLALVVVASSLAVGLPASVFNGIFIGLQRFEVPAITVGVSRVLSAVLLVFVARHGGGLTWMALVMAAVNLASYVSQFLVYRKLAPRTRISFRLVSFETGRELFDYCFSLTIWSLAMLLVTGLDLLLVGYFQFDAVAYYAVAATLITFLVGLQQAVFNVMIPSTAVQHARGSSKELGSLMLTATRYGSFLLLVTGLPLVLAAQSILSLWVGGAYAFRGATILQVLVIANIIRLSAVPYVMTLIGTGQQRLVVVTPLLEGCSNLIASIAGGYLFGALGVAAGTLLGSFIGVAGNILYNMPRTAGMEFRVFHYLRDGLLRPVLCAVPSSCAALIIRNSHASDTARYACLLCAALTTGYLLWRYGLIGIERAKLRSLRLALQT